MNIFSALIILVILFGCSDGSEFTEPTHTDNPTQDTSNYTYSEPDDLFDGWQVGRADEHGIRTGILEQLVNDRNNGKAMKKTSAICISRNGVLIFDEYFKNGTDCMASWLGNPGSGIDFDSDYLFNIQSSTKSVTSFMLGVAKYRGFDIDVDEHISSIFNDYSVSWDGFKADMTVKDFLTMSAGLNWSKQNDSASYNLMCDYADSHSSGDPLGYLFDLDGIHEPGTYFTYCSGLPTALGVVLERKTEISYGDFLEQYCFEPMQIDPNNYWFIKWANGSYVADGGLFIRIRDFMKFAQVFANGGTWNGTKILDQDWIDDSVNAHIYTDINRQDGVKLNYGYL